MAALAKQFAEGVADLASVKKSMDPPVSKAFPGVQTFVQSADAADKMGDTLSVKFKAALAAVAEYNKARDEFLLMDADVTKASAIYAKAVAAYVKKGRDYGEKSFMTGCQKSEKGLDQIASRMTTLRKYYGPIKTG